MHEASDVSLWAGDRSERPARRLKTPRFHIDPKGRPVFYLIDEMGCEYRFADGSTVSHARFVAYDLAGILLDQLTLDTVSFIDFNLSNFELQRATVSRVLFSGCTGGPVFHQSTVTDLEVAKTHDKSVMLRFFRCSVSRVLITDVTCGLELSRCTGNDVHIQRSRLVGKTIIGNSEIRELTVISCLITSSNIFKSVLINPEIYETEFKFGQWDDVELRFGLMQDTTIEGLRMTRIRFDATKVHLLRLKSVLAAKVSASWAEWINVQLVGGLFLAMFSQCLLRSLMFHGTRVGLQMDSTRAYGLRLCDVEGAVKGKETVWWRPVIRRSVLRGDGSDGVILRGADCTSTKFFREFGKWLEIEDPMDADVGHNDDSCDEQ